MDKILPAFFRFRFPRVHLLLAHVALERGHLSVRPSVPRFAEVELIILEGEVRAGEAERGRFNLRLGADKAARQPLFGDVQEGIARVG